MGRLKKERKPAQNQVEDGDILACTDTWCESYHDGSARNCLKEVGDFIVCPDRTRIKHEGPADEAPEIQACRNGACKHYDETFVLNCTNASSSKQKLADICKCELKEVPAPPINSAENHQENIVPEKPKQTIKKLQIILEERDLETIKWVDMMAKENRRDRNGQILTMLENMMLRDMEAA